jgi:hypothetical protein
MATVRAGPPALRPIVVLFAGLADMRLDRPDRAAAEDRVRMRGADTAGAEARRVTQVIATTPSRDMMGPVQTARVEMVHALAASPPRMAAHPVASFSRVPFGTGRLSVSPHRHSATVSPTRPAPRRTRQRAPSGFMGITPLLPRWPIQTDGSAACC